MRKGALILPKRMKSRVYGNTLDLRENGTRVYFLAGPILGANDWQANAIKMLMEKDPTCYIACPCLYDESHALYQFAVDPFTEPVCENFPSQTDWERYYLELASKHGSIIFWLAKESDINPRPKDRGPYARDTYGELGRWSVLHSFGLKGIIPQSNMVIGASKDFSGLSVIQKNLNCDRSGYGEFPIYNSLKKTLDEAVKIGKEKNPKSLFNSENC